MNDQQLSRAEVLTADDFANKALQFADDLFPFDEPPSHTNITDLANRLFKLLAAFPVSQPAATLAPCAHDYARKDLVCTECGEKTAPAADERAAFIEAYALTLPPENREVDPAATRRFAESVIATNGPGWQLWQAGIAYARAASSPAASIPEGWKLVPIEPTPEILTAIWQNERDSRRAWERAVATVPQPVQESPAAEAGLKDARVLDEITDRLKALTALKKRADSMPIMNEWQWLNSLRNRLLAAPQPAKADAPAEAQQPSGEVTDGRAYPEEMSTALRDVLGRPNFWCGPIAHEMRAAGAEIKAKAEDEQAHVLHWLVKLVLDHGDDWQKHAATDLRAIREKASAARDEGDES